MGHYNPHAPQILGQEWVPIRDEDVVFSPALNVYEVGHRFTTNSSQVLRDAKFYINTFPPGRSLGQVFLATIYNQGNEDATGPIRSVIVPCNAILVSGGASGTVADLMDPSDNNVVSFPSTGTPFAHLHFDLNSYSQLLNGKRIVGANFLYTLAGGTSAGDLAPAESLWGTLSIEEGSGGSIAVGLGAAQTQNSTVGSQVTAAQLGEIDHFWGGGAPNTTSERLPWRYQGLQDFEVSAGSTRLSITYRHQTNAGWIGSMNYAALEILFCEENRLYYGGKSFGESGFAAAHELYTFGANSITMRDLSYTANPVLAAGSYTLLIASADLGDVGGPIGLLNRKINLSQYPTLNGIRQLYPLPAHHGIQVNVTKEVDEVFTDEQVMILPQLSLHASGSPLTEVHVYGRQARAQVYGTVTATQEIMDSAAGGSRSYPWVRFYARRFGDTTVPLKLDSPSIAGSSVELTPSEWDALDEIIDGWKEVTLRFNTPPTMGTGTQPQWRWSAAGETAGNRWEVLGAVAPALSGTPGNLLNQAPTTQRLGPATYGMPVSGSSINLGWIPQYAPPVSATADDQSADATLLFAQDMATITGFAADLDEQEVTGIGLDCGVDPCCIPSAIDYVQLSWGPPRSAVFSDTFTRSESSTWGSADTGQTYFTDGGAASNYNVLGGYGQVLMTSTAGRSTFILPNWTDIDYYGEMQVDQLATGAAISGSLSARLTGADDTYLIEVAFNTDQTIQLRIRSRVAGTSTTLVTYNAPFVHSITAWYSVRTQMVGQTLQARIWLTGEEEPEAWHASIGGQTTYTTGGIGTRSFLTTGNSNTNPTVKYDNLQATPYYLVGAKAELQRMDAVETDWKTIMLASDLALTGFKDYEARVGIQSSYRIRLLDPYDFEGGWSSTVTATVPTPGVTIGCDDGHLLIFTSNEQQDGSINLAYSSVWENNVEENFTFAESRFVELQAMYNRDFFVAFRPTERGGEQFARTVLVQAAAISPETLANFTSLRDMAWADVSYVCVRDEDGNRWFATVLVPSGRVLRDRRLYLAPVEIIEVTDTPSQVDP